MLTGLTDKTLENLQLNAGVLLSQYTKGTAISASHIITATRGGGSFSVVQTMHQVAVDGAPTYFKGGERVDDVVVTLSVTALEMNDGAIKLGLGAGASMEEVGTGTPKDSKFTSKRTIKLTDYQDIWWVGDLSNGQKVAIKLKNALNTGGFNLTFTDRGEGTYALTLIGHFDVSDLDTAPYEITFERSATAA